jgi:hypothetical protein
MSMFVSRECEVKLLEQEKLGMQGKANTYNDGVDGMPACT